MASRSIRWLAVSVVVFALVLGAAAIWTEVQAGACRCPMIYAPVVCDKGRTYPNMCVAECHNARNCVPAGIY